MQELLCVDNSAFVAADLDAMQEIADHFATASNLFGLKINTTGMELLRWPLPGPQARPGNVVLVNGASLGSYGGFIYFGSAAASAGLSDLEVACQIQAAAVVFGALQEQLWSLHDIRRTTKLRVCSATVLPSLLCVTECMVLCHGHFRRLTRLQLQYLHQILKVGWQGRVSDVEVLRQAGTVGMEALVAASQLLWAGRIWHVSGMQLPRAIFCRWLGLGGRRQGGQRLRCGDILKGSI